MYNFVCAKRSLKGQCHEIFDCRFFHESVSPKPLSIPLGSFQICLKFAKIFTTQGEVHHRCRRWHQGQIYQRCHWYQWQIATGVIDTGGKFDTAGKFDTSGKFAAGIIDPGGKFTKMGTNVFLNSQIANLQTLGQFAIANPQISEICEFANFISAYLFWLICKLQIRKFRRWANPLNANPKIFPP